MTAKFNLYVDSCCDLTKEFLESNNVGCFHFSYVDAKNPEGGLSGVDDLFESRSAGEFYQAMRDGAEPMTSQPSQAEFEEAFRAAAQSDVPTVYLAFTSGLSGCYEGAMTALERIKEEKGGDVEIYVVDTKQASTALTLFVLEAIRQRDKGLTAQEMVRWAEEARYFVHAIFMVDDLKTLSRGGRIPSGVAVIGSLLDVKPMLTIDVDGKLAMVGMARGRKKAMRKFIEYYGKNHVACDYDNVVTLGNADCANDMQHFAKMLVKEDGTALPVETNIGPTIGCHVGPGMLSCCFWGLDRREGAPVSDRIASSVRES